MTFLNVNSESLVPFPRLHPRLHSAISPCQFLFFLRVLLLR